MPDLRWCKVSVFGCRIAYKSRDHIKAVQLIRVRTQQEPQAGWTLEGFFFFRFSVMMGRLDMHTHDIRRWSEQCPQGSGCFMQRHWMQDGMEGEKKGAGLRMRMNGCLSYCTK